MTKTEKLHHQTRNATCTNIQSSKLSFIFKVSRAFQCSMVGLESYSRVWSHETVEVNIQFQQFAVCSSQIPSLFWTRTNYSLYVSDVPRRWAL